MSRALWQDPYAGATIESLQDPARARAAAVQAIANARARSIEIQGAANANAATQSGNAWASGVQGATAALGAIPKEIQQANIDAQREKSLAVQTENQKAELGLRQQQLTSAQRLDSTRRAVGQLMSDPSVLNEDGTINAQGIVAKLSQPRAGEVGPQEPPDATTIFQLIDPINASIGQARDSRRVYEEHQTNALAHIASTVLKLGGDSGNYLPTAQMGVAAALKSGLITEKQADAFLVPMIEQPESAQRLLQSVAARSTLAPIKLGADDRLVDPLDPSKAIVAATGKPGEGQHVINDQLVGPDGKPIGAPVPRQTTPAEIETARHNLELERIAGLTAGRADAAAAETRRHNLATEAHATATDNAAPNLSPEALQLTAHQYAMTGQLPPMGMGKQGAEVRTKIINEAARIYQNLDLPSQQAAFAANKASLTNVTKTLDTLSAFESTAGKNLDQFLALADKIPDTGVPWLNQPLRSVDARVLGSADVAAFNAARDVALREITRVTNDPKLTGVVSDAARKETSALSPKDATFAQIQAVAKVLKQDMANVHSSMLAQRDDIQHRIATPPASAAPPAAPKLKRYDPATGKAE